LNFLKNPVLHKNRVFLSLLWTTYVALYGATTALDILAADSGEFQLAAARWGILHPPGYPLYTILGGIWLRIFPMGTLPFRLNLLSAVLAATTLVLTVQATRTWARGLRSETSPNKKLETAPNKKLETSPNKKLETSPNTSTCSLDAPICSPKVSDRGVASSCSPKVSDRGAAPSCSPKVSDRGAAPSCSPKVSDRGAAPLPNAYLGGFVAALALSAAPTFWAQATTANIRMPTMLFTAWGFLALGQFANADHPNQRDAALRRLALALGLGVSHHPSLIFVASGWALYLLLTAPRLVLHPRRWWPAAVIAAAAWGLPQLYLPLRGSMADVPLAPEGVATWSGFWHHVLARGFKGDMFAFANPSDLALRLPLVLTLFKLQFPPLILIIAGLSWLWLLWRRPRLALSLLISWGVHTFVTITYRAPQTVEYLMPAYLPLVLTLGLGVSVWASRSFDDAQGLTLRAQGLTLRAQDDERSKKRLPSTVYRLPFIILLLALMLRLPLRAPDFMTLAADHSTRARLMPLLDTAPPDALILADWRWATPLWVLQQVESHRPDIDVAYVYPVDDKTYGDVWRERATEAETQGRSLLSTHRYTWEDWTFAPVGGGYHLYHRPLQELPQALGFTPLEAELGPIQLRGYHINIHTSDGQARPGRRVELHLAWQAIGPQDPAPSLTARLWSATGDLLAQEDHALGSDTEPGEIRFTSFTLLLPLDRCSEETALSLGAYTVQDGAFIDLGAATLPEIPVICHFPTLLTQTPHPAIVLGAGPFLRGVDYDVNGEQATAYFHWCGPGKGMTVISEETQATVFPLAPGRCQTTRLPVPANQKPVLTLQRADGTRARMLGLPLPRPHADDRYIPFGDQMLLTDSRDRSRFPLGRTVTPSGTMVIDLHWRSLRPLVDDYAVSVRLLAEDGTWLGMHDFQPALSNIPTLKWVVRGADILDPHPFPVDRANGDTPPAYISLTVYERFRMTALPSTYGHLTTFPLAP
jgi:hypothetical protein